MHVHAGRVSKWKRKDYSVTSRCVEFVLPIKEEECIYFIGCYSSNSTNERPWKVRETSTLTI